MKEGDAVLIEWDDDEGPRRVEGTVFLASPNGRSLMLIFDAIVRGHVGMCPVLQDDDGTYRSVFDGQPISIRRRE